MKIKKKEKKRRKRQKPALSLLLVYVVISLGNGHGPQIWGSRISSCGVPLLVKNENVACGMCMFNE